MKRIEDIDGVPELPEGHFWSVKRSSFFDAYRVSIRKKLWIFSREVAFRLAYPDAEEWAEETLGTAACGAFRDMEMAAERMERDEEMGEYA